MTEARVPSVFDYLDYRLFLRDHVQFLRSKGLYSIRKFASAAQFKCSNYLHMIMTGRRNIKAASAKRVADALKLSPSETRYFLSLVKFNQAKDESIRAHLFRELFKARSYLPKAQLTEREWEALSSWRIAGLLVALTTHFRSWPPSVQAETLQCTEFQLSELKRLLRERQLIDEADWPTSVRFETPDEIQGLTIRKLHQEMIEQSLQASDRYPITERHLSFVTLSLSRASYERVSELIQEMRKELLSSFGNDQHPESIYQINFQIFPLIPLKPKGEKDVIL